MLGETGGPFVTSLLCFLFFAREAAGAAGTRHSLRPLFSRGRSCMTRARERRGMVGMGLLPLPLLTGVGGGPFIRRLNSWRVPLTRIAEPVIGRRFAPTRWQFDLSPQAGRGDSKRGAWLFENRSRQEAVTAIWARRRRRPIVRMVAKPMKNSATLLAMPQIDMNADQVTTSKFSATIRLSPAEKNIRPAQT